MMPADSPAAAPAVQHGGNVWRAAQEFDLAPEDIVDFSANLNPLGPPPGVLELLRQEAAAVRHYPEPQGGTLKAALADRVEVAVDQVVVGNGAAELIYLLCQVLKPRQVLLPVPTFGEYERAVRATGGETVYFPLVAEEGFRLPVEQLGTALATGGYDLLVLCNPNNPTGVFTPAAELGQVLESAQKAGTFVLLDASFTGFLAPAEQAALQGLVRDAANVFLLNSLTKLYCLPGLRLGYGCGPAALVAQMEAARDPWTVNTLAQLAGRRCLEEKAYVEAGRALIEEQRAYLFRGLEALPGVRPFPPSANFILVDLRGSGVPAPVLRAELGRRGLLIRDCSNFPSLDEFYIRVAVRGPAENRRLLTELAAALM